MRFTIFDRFSLGNKVLLHSAGLSLITVLVGSIGVSALYKVSADYEVVATRNLSKTHYLGELQSQTKTLRIGLRSAFIGALEPAERERALKSADVAVEAYEKDAVQYKELIQSADEKDQFEELQLAWGELKGIGKQITTLAKPGADTSGLAKTFRNEANCGNDINNILFTLNEQQQEASERALAHSRTMSSRARMLMILIGGLGVFTAFLLGHLFARSLSRKLVGISEALTEEATKIGESSSVMSSTSDDLAKAASDQASSVMTTASAVTEMNQMIALSTEKARISNEMAEKGQAAAMHGKEVVTEMIASIEEISTANSQIMHEIEQSNQQMSDIVKVISEIAAKTTVINDIVFQTKLLSFNASVEAARAGEHGKGFAVVAEEVGNLAQMSGNAAKEIEAMLDQSTARVEQIAQGTRTQIETLMSAGRSKVQAGTVVAHRCGDALDQLFRTVQEIGKLVHDITAASEEQAKGIQEINGAMGKFEKVTQQNDSTSKRSANAAKDLSTRADKLRIQISELVIAVSGMNKIS